MKSFSLYQNIMKKKIGKNEENYNSSIKIIYDNKYYFFSMETYSKAFHFLKAQKQFGKRF